MSPGECFGRLYGMAMGTRKKRERQEDLWMVSSEVVGTPAHAFYDRLNQILDQHHFDRNVEQLCRRYYKGRLGRPVSRRVSIFVCCCWGTSKGLIRNVELPGGWPTPCPCASSSLTP